MWDAGSWAWRDDELTVRNLDIDAAAGSESESGEPIAAEPDVWDATRAAVNIAFLCSIAEQRGDGKRAHD